MRGSPRKVSIIIIGDLQELALEIVIPCPALCSLFGSTANPGCALCRQHRKSYPRASFRACLPLARRGGQADEARNLSSSSIEALPSSHRHLIIGEMPPARVV